ncbi:MAG TPA: hypothetical protein VFF11_06905 [Candidatus Binatia bacterium]|nr:hypothetical protein [Candidatus Binatia bacterium]
MKFCFSILHVGNIACLADATGKGHWGGALSWFLLCSALASSLS